LPSCLALLAAVFSDRSNFRPVDEDSAAIRALSTIKPMQTAAPANSVMKYTHLVIIDPLKSHISMSGSNPTWTIGNIKANLIGLGSKQNRVFS